MEPERLSSTVPKPAEVLWVGVGSKRDFNKVNNSVGAAGELIGINVGISRRRRAREV